MTVKHNYSMKLLFCVLIFCQPKNGLTNRRNKGRFYSRDFDSSNNSPLETSLKKCAIYGEERFFELQFENYDFLFYRNASDR